jgi:hypothetical protein
MQNLKSNLHLLFRPWPKRSVLNETRSVLADNHSTFDRQTQTVRNLFTASSRTTDDLYVRYIFTNLWKHLAGIWKLFTISILITMITQLRSINETYMKLISGRWRMIIYSFLCRSRIFHSYGDVTIVGEGLQNLGFCSVLRAFEQGGIFNVTHLLWHGTSVFPVSFEGPPHLVASYDTRGDVEDLF